MKLVSMLQDIIQALFTKPATAPYPNPQPDAPEQLRGKLVWSPDGCTGCQLCVKDCPADAIEVLVLDKKNKQFVVRYDAGQCTFCGQCVQACRFGCLTMSGEKWSLAADSQAPFTIYYGDEADVEHVLAENTAKSNNEAK